MNPNDLNDCKHVMLEVVEKLRLGIIIRFPLCVRLGEVCGTDVTAMKVASYADFLSKIQPPQSQGDTLPQPALEGLGTLQLANPISWQLCCRT